MFIWGIQSGLFKDNEGIKAFFILRTLKHRFNKIMVLKKTPITYPKAPEEEDPTVLTEKPTGKIFDVEDMDKEPEAIKLIEPEDM